MRQQALEPEIGQDPVGGVEPRLLTAGEAAKTLSISPRKLWSMTAGGEIPCVRIGRSVRYAAADLAAFVEAQTSEGLR